jgi:hypothetical protein
MAMFVHLTPETRVKQIVRNGISRLRKSRGGFPGGIYSMPVTRNFYISHQWLRELRRRGARTFAAIYFRVPDDELVWVGHYGQSHQQMTASAATAVMMQAENREGFEVIISRKITAKEIHRVKEMPKILGWRYFPGAHGRKPCGCPYCQKGQYGAKKVREEYEKSWTK